MTEKRIYTIVDMETGENTSVTYRGSLQGLVKKMIQRDASPVFDGDENHD